MATRTHLSPTRVAVTVHSPDDPAWNLVNELRDNGFQGRVELVGHLPGTDARSLDRLPVAPDLLILSGDEGSVVNDLKSAKRFGHLAVLLPRTLPPSSWGRIAPFAKDFDILGPASEGVANTRHRFNSTTLRGLQIPGNVSLASLGVGALKSLGNSLDSVQLDYRHIVSLGSGWFIGLGEIIESWKNDPETRVVGIVLTPDVVPGELLGLLRSLSRVKPVVIFWPSRGVAALSRHTGAMVTADPRQFARLLASNVLFGHWGKGVALMGGDSHALSELAHTLSGSLELNPPTAESARLLHQLAVPERCNPVRLSLDAGPDDYLQALEVLHRDDANDVVVVMAPSNPGFETPKLATGLRSASRASRKPTILLSKDTETFGLHHTRDVLALEDPDELEQLLLTLSRSSDRRPHLSEYGRTKCKTESFSLAGHGLEARDLDYGSGIVFHAWRDDQLGPLVVRAGYPELAILPLDKHEALDFLAEVGCSDKPELVQLLLGIRGCFDDSPALHRLECESGLEPGQINGRNLRVELEPASN